MSHLPIEYWVATTVLLSAATLWLAMVLPVPPVVSEIAPFSFVVYLVLYAYSPLPQGPPAPGHKRRKRVWGFSPRYEDSRGEHA